MSILNLTKISNPGGLGYRISRFPDGQQSVTLTDENLSFSEIRDGNDVEIRSRLNSFEDLELIICATQALKELGVSNISLNIPYCIGGRSDRKFQKGGFNYIKTVIAPIINMQGYKAVWVLDPHSDVLEACINNFRKKSNTDLVRFALVDVCKRDNKYKNVCLVSPDAGAYKKIFDLAAEFGVENILTASKVRDIKTGSIIKTEVPGYTSSPETDFVVVDDICDGGRTFIELAKVLKEKHPNNKIYLVVTHGIFSAGLEELKKYFTCIYCTNSISNLYSEEFVKQFNVF